jgi:hypothetical protein
LASRKASRGFPIHLSRQFQSFSVGKGKQQFLGGHDVAQMFYKSR